MTGDDLYNFFLPAFRDFSLLFGWLWLLVSLLVGLVLVFKPELIGRLNNVTNTSFSFRRATRVLDTPNYIERWIYRHHRLTGILMLATSAYVSFSMLSVLNVNRWLTFFLNDQNNVIVEIALQTAWLFILMISVFAMITSVILFVRPSVLKGFEGWCNQWITTRQMTRSLGEYDNRVDLMVEKYPRTTGALIIIASVYAITILQSLR